MPKKEIIIKVPALEELARKSKKQFEPNEEEIAIVKKYYLLCSYKDIAKELEKKFERPWSRARVQVLVSKLKEEGEIK